MSINSTSQVLKRKDAIDISCEWQLTFPTSYLCSITYVFPRKNSNNTTIIKCSKCCTFTILQHLSRSKNRFLILFNISWRKSINFVFQIFQILRPLLIYFFFETKLNEKYPSVKNKVAIPLLFYSRFITGETYRDISLLG